MPDFIEAEKPNSSNGNAESVVADSLSAIHLRKTYARRRVVNDVSLFVGQGEIVGLLGANGAGKTTTFYMLTGLETAEGGRIFLNGQDVTKLPMYLRARLGLGYLPQEPSIFRKMSAEQNILAVLETMKMKRAERFARLDELLEEFGVASVRKTRGDALSGGERRRVEARLQARVRDAQFRDLDKRRRVEIARCLATEPQYILLDEPFAGIDPLAIDDIREIILYLKNQGIGILITDHNVRETLGITDRAYIMTEGAILRSGAPHELVEDADVRRLYLGERFSL